MRKHIFKTLRISVTSWHPTSKRPRKRKSASKTRFWTSNSRIRGSKNFINLQIRRNRARNTSKVSFRGKKLKIRRWRRISEGCSRNLAFWSRKKRDMLNNLQRRCLQKSSKSSSFCQKTSSFLRTSRSSKRSKWPTKRITSLTKAKWRKCKGNWAQFTKITAVWRWSISKRSKR